MRLFRKLRKVVLDGRRAEESLYAIALQEVEGGDLEPGSWAKAFADSDGNETRAKALYLKRRVQSMKDELTALAASGGSTPDRASPGELTPEPHWAWARGGTNTPPDDDRSGFGWLLTALLLSGLSVALIGSRIPQPRSRGPHGPPSSHVSAPASAPAPRIPRVTSPPATNVTDDVLAKLAVFTTTDRHSLIPEEYKWVSTIAGNLHISPAPSQQYLTLKGQTLNLPVSFFEFLSITRFSNQDIVLVGLNCGGSGCTFLDLAFVRLFSDRPPDIETHDSFQYPTLDIAGLKNGINFENDQIRLSLGITDGTYRFATIGADLPLQLTKQPALIAALSAEDCAAAAELLSWCSEFAEPCADSDVPEFPRNCPSAAMVFYRSVGYLARHTTGLNLPKFADACTTASRVGMRPSDDLISSAICSGANPTQWAAVP